MTRKVKPGGKYGWQNTDDVFEYLYGRGYIDLSIALMAQEDRFNKVTVPSIRDFTAKDAAALMFVAEQVRKFKATQKRAA